MRWLSEDQKWQTKTWGHKGFFWGKGTEVWTKPRRRPRNSWVRTVTNDLANSYTGLPEAREDAQDRVYWRMFTKHSAMHS